MSSTAFSLALAPLVLSFLGCSSTRYIRPAEGFSHIGKARIFTRDQGAMEISSARKSGDTLIVGREAPEGMAAIPLMEVEKVTVRSRGKGVLQGAGIGLMAGTLLGFMVAGGAAASHSSCEVDCTDDGFEDLALITAAIYLGPLIGLAAGAGAGSIEGATIDYVFMEPRPDTVARPPALFREGKAPAGPNSW